jgi:gamma-glutamylaminecyclotransferase
MTNLFVYGTLKRGGSNEQFLAGQRFISEARTRALFRLFELDGYPGMVAVETAGLSIGGEIWEVNAECLQRLDDLEGTAIGLYRRAAIPLLPPHDGMVVEGYLYLLSVAGRSDLGDHYPVGA